MRTASRFASVVTRVLSRPVVVPNESNRASISELEASMSRDNRSPYISTCCLTVRVQLRADETNASEASFLSLLVSCNAGLALRGQYLHDVLVSGRCRQQSLPEPLCDITLEWSSKRKSAESKRASSKA